ncbi:anti-sigma factor family protein [Aeromicrobium alkaliterrae]|uniref:Putative zinc-finger domain-containing protein n=1 Tax=Aeromicrobium alkaliterrae TaxID=302168 RepID=A0ABP4WD27_9ACTN
MTHLGADVAAFVDGQLSPARESAARRHLDECERCRELVVQQEQLKRRMASGARAGVPPHLAAALAAVAADPGEPDPRGRQALQRSLGVVVALMGSSAAVLLLAYVLAPPLPTTADPVSPDFDAYAAEFLQEAASQRAPDIVAASAPVGGDDTLSTAELDELDADGWPCHMTLAGDLERVEGRLVGDAEVSLRYSGEHVQLQLIEQIGSLEPSAMTGFQLRTVAGSDVWVRDGIPTVAAWEADGIVYTVVTDASAERIAQVVGQLPSTPTRSTVERIEDGLHRMTSWVSAA